MPVFDIPSEEYNFSRFETRYQLALENITFDNPFILSLNI